MALKQHSFLGNGRETDNGTTSLAREQILNKQEQTTASIVRIGKHVPAANNTRMNGGVYEGSAEETIRKTTGSTKSVLYGRL
jgi:hypothetical protein